MASDLLFELGTEELPSKAVKNLGQALARNIEQGLHQAGLDYTGAQWFATPRRLAVLVESVQDKQESRTELRRGPSYAAGRDEQGNPTKALQGFARSCGVSVDELIQIKTDKGAWWGYEKNTPGLSTRSLLPEFIKSAVSSLPIAKSMRWGQGEHEFVRPVHWAVLLFGNEVVEAEILGVKTGRESRGHRFHHPGVVEISSPSNYASVLEKAFVIASFSERCKQVTEQVTHLASSHDCVAEIPEALVDEVTSIVEWPKALLANFEPEFLDVPSESLIASMQSHQKCFALKNKAGELVPHFITVANIASNKPEQVLLGNEKVMRARLSDAAFFFAQDKKKPLADYFSATQNVIFQVKLGTLADKARRVMTLMEGLNAPLALNKTHAERAAMLSKCDLLTGMVGEFPELQGLMGYYYALNDGEPEAVAIAINEQYLPKFSGDNLPESKLGMALSLTERLDTLVGIFAIGQRPTGVKDPFKLRRHALAVGRILMALPEAINLSTLLEEALDAYGEPFSDQKACLQELAEFILERLRSYFQAQDISQDRLLAVLERQSDWFFDINLRLKAVQQFVEREEALSLSSACKRVKNILQKAEQEELVGTVEDTLLYEAEEQFLYESICSTEDKINPLYAEGKYEQILSHLAQLKKPIDAFFEHVMVMDDDLHIRKNRLRLLARLQDVLKGVADISLLNIES